MTTQLPLTDEQIAERVRPHDAGPPPQLPES